MSFLRPIRWYHSQADPILLDGTFKAGARLSKMTGYGNRKKPGSDQDSMIRDPQECSKTDLNQGQSLSNTFVHTVHLTQLLPSGQNYKL